MLGSVFVKIVYYSFTIRVLFVYYSFTIRVRGRNCG